MEKTRIEMIRNMELMKILIENIFESTGYNEILQRYGVSTIEEIPNEIVKCKLAKKNNLVFEHLRFFIVFRSFQSSCFIVF